MASNIIEAPSAMSLLIQMRVDEQPLASGTAFVVQSENGPVLITNRHNVTGRHQDTGKPLSDTGGIPNNLMILHNKQNQLGKWLEKSEPLYDQAGEPNWLEHPILKAKADIVALPLTQLDGVGFYPYDLDDLGPDIHIGPGEVLSVIGFPFGITVGGSLGVWATGFVASEPSVDYCQLPVFLIDSRTRPGQSGSPVIAHRSGGMIAMANGTSASFSGPVFRFLGIYSGRINPDSDLGIVWKARALRELIP